MLQDERGPPSFWSMPCRPAAAISLPPLLLPLLLVSTGTADLTVIIGSGRAMVSSLVETVGLLNDALLGEAEGEERRRLVCLLVRQHAAVEGLGAALSLLPARLFGMAAIPELQALGDSVGAVRSNVGRGRGTRAERSGGSGVGWCARGCGEGLGVRALSNIAGGQGHERGGWRAWGLDARPRGVAPASAPAGWGVARSLAAVLLPATRPSSYVVAVARTPTLTCPCSHLPPHPPTPGAWFSSHPLSSLACVTPPSAPC